MERWEEKKKTERKTTEAEMKKKTCILNWWFAFHQKQVLLNVGVAQLLKIDTVCNVYMDGVLEREFLYL